MASADGPSEVDGNVDSQTLRAEQAREGDALEAPSTAIAKGGVNLVTTAARSTSGEEQDNETSPLLRRQSDQGDEDEDNRRPSESDIYDFQHLPWYNRPSIWWVLIPFFLMACAFGGSITPKLNLILELVCRDYMAERMLLDPNFSVAPINFEGGDNDQCRIPEVSSRVAQFTLWCNLIAGLLAAIMSPKLGALSDRYGRKKILIVTSIGTICGEIITIFAASYPERFPVNLLLLGFAFDGLTGSFTVAMAISNSYATDCTPPARRNVAFGFFHGCLFSGVALGPIIAGYIVKKTGRIAVIFFVLTAVHLFFVTFVCLFVPESLSRERQLAARERHKKKLQEDGIMSEFEFHPRNLNLIKPLKVLWPTGRGTSSALRRNLIMVSAVDTMCFGVAMGSMSVLIIYTNYEFGWKTFESGRFLTIVNATRVICLVLVLPGLTRLARGKLSKSSQQRNHGADRFDLTLITVAILFDTLGFLGYTLSRTGAMFTLSGSIASIGGMGSPTLQSVLTKHVPPEQTGQLLGATGLLHALARVVAPTIFNAIYSATVGKFTQTVFACLASTFGLAFIISFFIKPHVYFDTERVEDEADTALAAPDQSRRWSVAIAATAVASSIQAALGLAGAPGV